MAQLRMLADDTEGAQEWGNQAVALARTFARACTNLGATHVKHRRHAVGEEVLQEGIAFCADRDLESWTSSMRAFMLACDAPAAAAS